MKTNYNTVVICKEVDILSDAVRRCPYSCIRLEGDRYGFIDNKNGDIRNYFCDTLGNELSESGYGISSKFDFEYLDDN